LKNGRRNTVVPQGVAVNNEQEHVPGLPKEPTPPADLQEAAQTIAHDSVAQVGLTTTREGDWALLVRVKPDAAYPIPEIESQVSGHPVIYQQVPATLPIARPAFPRLGE
jgi:predicted amidohydrolase YtcJ